jgi:histone H3
LWRSRVCFCAQDPPADTTSPRTMPRSTQVDSGKKGKKDAKKTTKKPSGGEKKQRRWKAGTVALREIRKLQKGSKLLIQKAPFQRLVRASLAVHKQGLSFKPSALEAVQEAAESYMVGLFEGAVILQLHRGKKTLNNKDLNYTRRIRGELSAQGH